MQTYKIIYTVEGIRNEIKVTAESQTAALAIFKASTEKGILESVKLEPNIILG